MTVNNLTSLTFTYSLFSRVNSSECMRHIANDPSMHTDVKFEPGSQAVNSSGCFQIENEHYKFTSCFHFLFQINLAKPRICFQGFIIIIWTLLLVAFLLELFLDIPDRLNSKHISCGGSHCRVCIYIYWSIFSFNLFSQSLFHSTFAACTDWKVITRTWRKGVLFVTRLLSFESEL